MDRRRSVSRAVRSHVLAWPMEIPAKLFHCPRRRQISARRSTPPPPRAGEASESLKVKRAKEGEVGHSCGKGQTKSILTTDTGHIRVCLSV